MWQWWNSLEGVARVLWWMNILVFVIPALVTITMGGLRLLIDNRYKHLATQRQQELEKPRHLSPQQQEQFLAIVKEDPRRILVASPTGDPEAFALARQLRDLLGNASWDIDGQLGETVFDPPLFGIQIELDRATESEEQLRKIIDTELSVLKRALQAVGMPSTSTRLHSRLNMVPYKGIKLYIGHKPKPSD